MELFKINVQVHWILMSTWGLEQEDPEEGGHVFQKSLPRIYLIFLDLVSHPQRPDPSSQGRLLFQSH